jgi:hypothetical protein
VTSPRSRPAWAAIDSTGQIIRCRLTGELRIYATRAAARVFARACRATVERVGITPRDTVSRAGNRAPIRKSASRAVIRHGEASRA